MSKGTAMPRRSTNNNSNVATRRSAGKNKITCETAKKPKGKGTEKQMQKEETPYERLYRQVVENKNSKRKKKDEEPNEKVNLKTKRTKMTVENEPMEFEVNNEVTITQFMEDGNFIDMGVSEEERREFPSPSEEEQDSDSDSDEESVQGDRPSNNNKEMLLQTTEASLATSSERSGSTLINDIEDQEIPVTNNNRPIGHEDGSVQPVQPRTSDPLTPDMHTFNLMQSFMIKKGLIDRSMTEQEMEEFVLLNNNDSTIPAENASANHRASSNDRQENRVKRTPKKKLVAGTSTDPGMLTKMQLANKSPSEVTIYRRAVPSTQETNPHISQQIEDFIGTVRESVTINRKMSTSSEEGMDTSDEGVNVGLLIDSCNIVDDQRAAPADEVLPPRKMSEQQAAELIRDAEKSKVRLFEVPGKMDLNTTQPISIASIDEDYQMIDSHIDEATQHKIVAFEYVDFCKLIPKNKTLRDDEQCMEMVSRNGMTYFAPVDRDTIQISSYGKWEQAFRVYSNILTSKFPTKSTELLQYNHTIHTASMSYIWENVYAYDREFRQHVGHHPSQTWSVILQQAWTMLLKDRIKSQENFFHKSGGGKSKKEPCRRFNKGSCTFGLSCKYDHRCAIKKCGKFGHGAHICRLRNTEQTTSERPEEIDKKSSN